MQTGASRLKPLQRQDLQPDCNLILVIVPGIDTAPVPSWRKGSIITSIQTIIGDSIFKNPHVVWWDHGLPKSRLLSYQHQQESAEALRRDIYHLISQLLPRQCPIIFVGHSIGGLLIKETIGPWDQAVDRNESNMWVAGAVFLGTPHTRWPEKAVRFCEIASRAFLTQKYSDNESQYAHPMTKLCIGFEPMDLPSFSIFEIEKTKLKTLKYDIIVDQELARLGNEDKLWSMRATHKDLCHGLVSAEMHEALKRFLVSTIEAQWARINSPWVKRLSQSTRSLPSLRTIASEVEINKFMASPVVSSPLTSISSARSDGMSSDRRQTGDMSHRRRITGIEYNIPQLTNQAFPRDDILKPVEEMLLRSSPWQDSNKFSNNVRAFALCGNSGMGKSLSALQFVYKHRSRYENVFWVNAENPSKLFSAYLQIANRLGSQEGSHELRDRFESQRKTCSWLESESPHLPNQTTVPWLLVFDNVVRIEDLKDFWPSKGGGDILVTTERSLEELKSLAGLFGVDIQPFGKDVALKFLQNLSPEKTEDPLELVKAASAAEMLGGSPLALMWLSSLINQGSLDPDSLQQAARRQNIPEFAPMRLDLSGEWIQSMNALVEPLLNKLKISSSLMDVICLLDMDGAHEWILMDSARPGLLNGFPEDRQQYYAAKAELLQLNLVGEVKVSDVKGIAAYRMIRKVVRQRMMDAARFQTVFEATVEMLWNLWPRMNLEDRHNVRRWTTSDALMRHVRCLLEVSPIELELRLQPSVLLVRLLNNAAWSLYEQGDYEDAKSFAEQAREIAENIETDGTSLGSEELTELCSQVYYTLGAVAQITHQTAESLEYHARMLVLRETLQTRHRSPDQYLAHAYNEIGNDFMRDDRYEIAIGFYQTSIRIYEKLDGVTPSTLALPRVNLGLAYWLKRDNDNEKALEIVQQALEEHEQEMRGPDDGINMKTGRLLFAMGNITYDLGKRDESLKYHERAYNQFKATIGRGHNRSCDVLWRLAHHYEERQEYNKALTAVNDALENLWSRPLFEREKARLLFKRARIMKQMREYSEPVHYEKELNMAYEIYRRVRPDGKQTKELDEDDFNDLVMFWSR